MSDDGDREHIVMACAAILVISLAWGVIKAVREHTHHAQQTQKAP